MLNQVITGAGRPDWDGNIAATKAGWTQPYTKWVDFHNPTVSPLDDPTPMLYGSGPFILTTGTPDYVNKFWAMYRNVNYWRGWPAAFPVLGGIGPAGFCNTVEVTWAFGWATRKTMFLQGDADFVALPSTAYIKELYQSTSPPFDPPTNYPLQGVRCIHPLATLQCDSIFFTFHINPVTTWETVGSANEFNPGNVPPDLFGNAVWGVHMRRAFAKAFNYAYYIATALRGEGVTPATALIGGLAYHDASVVGYSYNLAAAKFELDQCIDKYGKKVTDVGAGFTLNLYYNTGNLARETGANLLKAALESATCDPNHMFTINVISIDWGPYLTAAVQQNLAIFTMGWLADFPDPHDFVLPFYHTGGTFAVEQAYSNSTIDALIDQGIATPNGPARQAIYHTLQVDIVQDEPSIPISQPVGRHFEIDWVNGWYYNPIYPGGYYYNRWKWYYIPEVRYNLPWSGIAQPNSTDLPADLTYDGKVLIDDVATVAQAFGTNPSSARWMFRGDITGDRKILIDDVAYVSKQFGKKGQPIWTPQGLLVYITPAIQLVNATQAWTFTSTVIGGTGPYTYTWSVNGTALGGNNANERFLSPGEASYGIQLNVTDSGGRLGQSEVAWVTSAPLTVTIFPANRASITIGTQTFDSSVSGGTDDASLEGGYHYQWFSNQTTGIMHVVGTHPTYLLETTLADIGAIEVYLRVTDESTDPGPQVVVDSAHTVVNVFAVSIYPASATLNVTLGESQTFASTVAGITAPYSYQWYDNTTGSYLPVFGETGSTYTFTPTTSGIYGVYLVATDPNSISVQSGTSIVTAVFSVSISPASATLNVTLGESQTFTSTVADATLPISYQWYDNTTLSYLPVFGETGSTYTFTPTTSGIYGVYLVATDPNSISVQSGTSIVTAVFSVSISPASATLNVTLGESQTFTSTVADATLPISYQWYDNTTLSYLPVFGETGSTYTFTPTTSGIYGVYLVATDPNSISVQSGTSIVTAVL